MNKLSIILPAYNEENTIDEILNKIKAVQLVNNISKEIIIVDDYSQDKTLDKAKSFIENNKDIEIKLCIHDTNQGKGAAIHTGIEQITGDYMIVQDADLETDPEEYNILLEPVLKGNADVVIGSRFIGGKPHRLLTFWHYLGNKTLTLLTNLVTNLNLTDMECCFKLIKSNIIKGLKLKEKRFGFEPEVVIKLSRVKHIKIFEVGISYYARTLTEGKKLKWGDGFSALYCILRYGLFR